jgi:hypothetical protein
MPVAKQNVGNAGEYYIASRLSALDFVVTITLGRAEKYDILALSPNGRLVKVSVKTTQVEGLYDFPLSKKDESGADEDFYYAFVKLNGFKKEPNFWIIPSKVVSTLIRDAHVKYLETPGKKERLHKDSSMRVLPVEQLKGARQLYYPPTWNNELNQYTENLSQLI